MVLVLGASSPAFADPPIQRPNDPVAIDHLDKATKLYNVQAFEQAVEEYKAGALVDPAPVFDYDLGQCYRQLHRYKEAIWHYQRFLKASPQTPEHDEAVKKFIDQMQAELDQKAMTAPPTEDANASAAPTPAPVVVAPAQPVVQSTQRDWLGWGLAGTGVVAIGVSTYFLLDARSLDNRSNTEPGQTEQHALRDDAHGRRLVGGVIGGVGAAAVIAGIAKLVLDPGTTDRSQTSSIRVGVTSNGFAIAGRF
jgi:tetratricopeptide (TPR) repeat protein